MRKSLLLISLLTAAVMSATEVNLNWYSSLVSPAGKPQTQIFDIQINGSGDAFVLGHTGSISATDESSFLNTTFTGADYGDGGSYNKNLLFTKVNLQGNLIWTIRSTDGDYSDGAFCATADGGAVLALKFRLSNKNQVADKKSSYMTLVDATGKAHSLETTYTGSNFQHLVLVNITPTGEITKMTPLWAASVAPNGTATDVASITAIAQDEEGNLYFAGKQALDIAIGTDTLHAVHTGEWDGDMQGINNYSNSFIIKTDKGFNHLAHVTATGTVTSDQIMKMSYKNGKLMVIGHILTADAAKTFQLGGKEVTINDRSILVAQLDKDLTCSYIAPVQQVAAGDRNKGVQLQQMTWAEDGNSIFVVGGIQNGILFKGTEIYAGGGTAPGKMYDGIIMHIDAATGNLLHATFAGNTALNQHTGIVTFGKDTILTVNYASGGGVNLYKYTADLQFVDKTQLAKGGAMNVTASAARHENTLLMTFRARGGSDVTLADKKVNESTEWYNTLVAWTVSNALQTPTEDIKATNPSNGDKAQKVIIDGKLFIRRGNQLFNALGQPL